MVTACMCLHSYIRDSKPRDEHFEMSELRAYVHGLGGWHSHVACLLRSLLINSFGPYPSTLKRAYVALTQPLISQPAGAIDLVASTRRSLTLMAIAAVLALPCPVGVGRPSMHAWSKRIHRPILSSRQMAIDLHVHVARSCRFFPLGRTYSSSSLLHTVPSRA